MKKARNLTAVLTAAVMLSAECGFAFGGSCALPQKCIMQTGLSAAAADFESGTEGAVTYQKYADHAVLTGYDKTEVGVVRIPEQFGGQPVTAIADNAFSGCKKITSVEFPDSLTAIGENAFADCESLAAVKLNDKIAQIGSGAFRDCTALVRIYMPDSVKQVGKECFKNCSGLATVGIGGGLTVIAESAFENCTALVRMELPKTVRALGMSAFAGCS